MAAKENSDYIEIISKCKRIALIDADLVDHGTRHPNLAMMKISAYAKEKGVEVDFLYTEDAYEKLDDYEAVFISRVFTFTQVPDDLEEYSNVYTGGTGFSEDGGKDLPYEIEHHMPDYNLYKPYVEHEIKTKGKTRSWFADYLDYSIGFLTRGCFRKCSFCVNKKYDHAFPHSKLEEFVDPNRPYVYFWDDNFFACPKWEELFDEIEAMGKPFQFRQGLDERLLTVKKAKRLSRSKYRGDMIFAFDHVEDRELIIKKLKIWRRYSAKGTRFYLLCAYDSIDSTDIENVFKRIVVLMHFGCLPYIMRYETYKQSKWRGMYVQLARWCNQPNIFKKMSFRQFCEANQEYSGTKHKLCSSMRALTEFETAHPEIAAIYFDLRYEELNMFGEYEWFEKKHVQDCGQCAASIKTLDKLMIDEDTEGFIREYILGDLTLECLEDGAHQCSVDIHNAMDFATESLLSITTDQIIEMLIDDDAYQYIGPANIPQFSNVEDACKEVPELLHKYPNGMTWIEIGTFLDNGGLKNDTARNKYGENHLKFAALLDLAVMKKAARTKWMGYPSLLGEHYIQLDEQTQKQVLSRLLFKIPVIRAIMTDACKKDITIEDYLYVLSESTVKRRLSNVRKALRLVRDLSEPNSQVREACKHIEGL